MTDKPHLYYIIYDWETGGFDAQKNPCVELAMIALRADNFEEVGRIDDILVPYNKKGEVVDYDLENELILKIDKKEPKESQDVKKEINQMIESKHDFVYTEGAQSVHGIKESDMMLSGIEPKEVVKKIIELSKAAQVSHRAKAVLVGHNPKFDRSFTQQIFEVTGNSKEMSKIFEGAEDYYGNFQPHAIDTQDLAKLKWHKNEEEIENYKLVTCAAKSGLDLVGSHRAMNDVVTTKELLLYFKKLLRSEEISDVEKRDRDDFKFEI